MTTTPKASISDMRPQRGTRVRVIKCEPLNARVCYWDDKMDAMVGKEKLAHQVLPNSNIVVVEHNGEAWYLMPHWYEVIRL